MAPTKQKALVIDKKQGKMALTTVDVPKPGPNDILIRIQSVGLNPLDWKIHKLGIYRETYPAVLGSDIAGDVVEVGEAVTNVKVGDRVFTQGAHTNEGAGFQQYAVEKSDIIGKLPDNWNYDDAATLNVSFVAAYLGLFNKPPNGHGLPNPLAGAQGQCAGQSIVILGGSGSVGQYAIQLARIAGFATIITTASPKYTDYLKSLGATHIVDRTLPTESLALEIFKINGDQASNCILDGISSAETQQMGYDILAPGGYLVIVSADLIKTKVEGKAVGRVQGFVHLDFNYDATTTLYNNFTPLLEEGAIKPVKVEVVPNGLEGVLVGLERLEKNQVSGQKLVVRPPETP